jgi:hypothetical protein
MRPPRTVGSDAVPRITNTIVFVGMAIQGAEQRQAISAAVDWSLPAFGDRHLSKFGVDTAHVLCHSIDMRRALRKRRTCAPSRASSLSDRERLSAL